MWVCPLKAASCFCVLQLCHAPSQLGKAKHWNPEVQGSPSQLSSCISLFTSYNSGNTCLLPCVTWTQCRHVWRRPSRSWSCTASCWLDWKPSRRGFSWGTCPAGINCFELCSQPLHLVLTSATSAHFLYVCLILPNCSFIGQSTLCPRACAHC